MTVDKMYAAIVDVVKNILPNYVIVTAKSLLHDWAVMGIGHAQVGGLAGRSVLRGRHIRVRVDGRRVSTAVALPWLDRTDVGVWE